MLSMSQLAAAKRKTAAMQAALQQRAHEVVRMEGVVRATGEHAASVERQFLAQTVVVVDLQRTLLERGAKGAHEETQTEQPGRTDAASGTRVSAANADGKQDVGVQADAEASPAPSPVRIR